MRCNQDDESAWEGACQSGQPERMLGACDRLQCEMCGLQ